jgi:hypothetical protein
MRDVSVPDGDQVVDQSARTGQAVADDEVAVGVRQRAVEQHEGKTAAEQRKNAVP